ncbi:sulfatase-like hydrolase/transferase [Pedobacter hartonius]|uniref:Arylsulfatase A n=1 Tax=Pedobacter hartonius TaxID=425514 RepID=A0A1H3WQG8_9SPHI|nr:sulfatase-like hydrolase/transferase [Pedobacter hartonius]SDZ88594.1 Arylsulfatase A [Pedobacter hartonius]
MADDLGYGDVGAYGQKLILTPNIDQMAKEGLRFTDFYAGAPVCSPSRGSLLTGLNTGHATIRGNNTITGGIAGKKGKQTINRTNLSPQDYTIGSLMHDAGYTTSLVGKWHVDGYDTLATPLQHGFDKFSGWLVSYPETYASTYWPEKRYIDGKLVTINENVKGKRGYYETNLCTDEAIEFLSTQKDASKPFFLMLNFNNPHSPLEVPDQAIFANKDWPEDMKTYAAMVYYMDKSVARVKDYLIKSGLSKNTIVFFASDNGPRSEPSTQLTAVSNFFDSNGLLKGHKRDMYDGGIRVPLIIWSPYLKKLPKMSNVPGYFADIMPTFAEIAGKVLDHKTDGASLYSAIKGTKTAGKDRFLYWEFFENGFEQAVRYGKWKAVVRKSKLELYNLQDDIGEKNDIATLHPDIVKQIETYLLTARTDSPYWPVR